MNFSVRFCIFFIITFLGHSGICAQDKVSITFSAGYQNGALLDRLFSPLNYTKNGIKTIVECDYKINKSTYLFKLGYENSTLTAPISANFKTIFHNASTQIGYMYKIWEPSSSMSLMCGGSYAFDIYATIYNVDSYSYIAAHSLKALGQFNWIINKKHHIYNRLDFNPINLVSRPPYNRIPEDFDENTHSVSYYLFRD